MFSSPVNTPLLTLEFATGHKTLRTEGMQTPFAFNSAQAQTDAVTLADQVEVCQFDLWSVKIAWIK